MTARAAIARAGFLAVLSLAGCGADPGDAVTIKGSAHPKVFEGLPSPGYEPEVFKAEKAAKPTVEFGGYPMYRDTLDVSDADIAALVAILGDRSTYESFEGEKKCGGFHPDYAVEWTHEGATYRTLICFGCSEFKVIGPRGESRFDMAEGVSKRLKAILKPLRKNRPRPLAFSPGYLSED